MHRLERHQLVRTLTTALASYLAVSCAPDRGSGPVGPQSPNAPGTQPEGSVAFAVDCEVDAMGGSLECGSASASANRDLDGLNAVILGGQDQFIRLSDGDSESYASGTDVFSADVTVENLIEQALGTPDGTSSTGIRVFFHTGPTNGVTVRNADGGASFTGSAQPFFEYGSILDTNQTSSPKTWEFDMNGATSFSFTVLVDADVPHPNGWVEVSPATESVGINETASLSATVYDVVGRTEAASIEWSSGDPSIATVSGGTVTGEAPGTVTISAATSGDHAAGTADVTVLSRVTKEIGTSGGTIASADGNLEIEFPSGALEGTATVTVENQEISSLGDGPAYMSPDVGPYEVQLSGAELISPATVTLYGAVAELLEPEVWTFEGSNWVFKAPTNSTSNSISVETTTFSSFVLWETDPLPEIGSSLPLDLGGDVTGVESHGIGRCRDPCGDTELQGTYNGWLSDAPTNLVLDAAADSGNLWVRADPADCEDRGTRTCEGIRGSGSEIGSGATYGSGWFTAQIHPDDSPWTRYSLFLFSSASNQTQNLADEITIELDHLGSGWALVLTTWRHDTIPVPPGAVPERTNFDSIPLPNFDPSSPHLLSIERTEEVVRAYLDGEPACYDGACAVAEGGRLPKGETNVRMNVWPPTWWFELGAPQLANEAKYKVDWIATGQQYSDQFTGDLEVTAATAGENLDTDGYEVGIDAANRGEVQANGSTGFRFLDTGQHSVELVDIASNCRAVSANPQSVNVQAGQTAQIQFEVECTDKDLSAESVSGPSEASPGDDITVNVSARNLGGVSIPAGWTWRVVLSENPTISPSDDFDLLDYEEPNSLDSGERRSRSLPVSLPSALPDGQYYLGVYLDPGDQVFETDESNNDLISGTPITVSSGPQTVTLTAVADATLSADSEAGTNFGTKDDGLPGSHIVVGKNYAFTWLGSAPETEYFQGLLRFDLSAIPSGVNITDVTLRLHSGTKDTESSGHLVEVIPVESSWSETQVTYNTRPQSPGPAVASYAYDSCGICTISSTGLTTMVQDWVSGTVDNYGLALIAPDAATGSNFSVGYHARHGDNPDEYPKLIVTYEP